MAPSQRTVVTNRALALVVALFGALVTLVYLPSVHSMPSADDFLAPAIVRGASVHSLLEFFWRSPMDDYRPLQWIVAALTIRPASDVFAALHVLTLAAFIPYAFVLLLWIKRLRFSAIGATCTVAVVFLHPVLAGPLGELDAFGRFFTSAPMWLGVLAADRYAKRLPLALGISALCLVVALGFSEYAVGMVAMAPVAVFFQRSERRTTGAVAMGAVLVAVLAVYLQMRHVATGGSAGAAIGFNPIDWGRNTVVMTAGLLYPGNSIHVALGTGAGRYVLLAAGCGIVAAWLGIGLWLSRTSAGTPGAQADAPIVYLLSLLGASYAPMFARTHVSEIYLTAPIFAVGLLAGRAAEGWNGLPRARAAAFTTLAAVMAWGMFSASVKQRAIAARGARADQLIRSLLGQVPADIRDTTVWLVFPSAGPRYSTFVSGDDFLIQPDGPAQRASEWFWPGRGIKLRHAIGQQGVSTDTRSDLVLCWSPPRSNFYRAGGDGTCPSVVDSEGDSGRSSHAAE
jgi:hypothetical protein